MPTPQLYSPQSISPNRLKNTLASIYSKQTVTAVLFNVMDYAGDTGRQTITQFLVNGDGDYSVYCEASCIGFSWSKVAINQELTIDAYTRILNKTKYSINQLQLDEGSLRSWLYDFHKLPAIQKPEVQRVITIE